MIIFHDNLIEEAKYVSSYIRRLFKTTVSVRLENSLESGLHIIKNDIIIDESYDDDDWAFGYATEKLAVVSVARLKSKDKNLYLKRLLSVCIHEVGHIMIGDEPEHYKKAYWFNSDTNKKQYLSRHCDDSRCIMYETVDLKPPKNGYLILGSDKKYDAGLDDLIKRRYKSWFCDDCRRSLKKTNI